MGRHGEIEIVKFYPITQSPFHPILFMDVTWRIV
jgi:hypothetical protein